ncbi:patatin-like phospholipase family protein [Marivita hallyeonensis]|uniref:Patatin-like phospholipase n=1 Tax=Marivita hallyeonensis TaxID=996342 RepID=A0A1M5UUM8_9RHOB|nr:patatin-like phospholipase family protein [Marivita hallyeonensis]SHH66712.1 Patatin-like phospholipase [Marivita hallyeonensis]
MTANTPHFDQLVFSGGGLRCFWQGGFLEVVRDAISLDPTRITGVSGGALAACCFVARKGRTLLDVMTDRFAETSSNIAWDTFDEDGVTPHQRLYRECVEEVLDQEARRAIADGPSLIILLGHPPLTSAPKLSGTAATLAYEAELHTIASPHFNWAEKMGLTSSRVDARVAARDGTLHDLISAAAVIPPVFEPPTWDGTPVVDGGMADQAPMPDPDEGDTLVLLTRHYSGLTKVDGRTYLEPSEPCPVDKIDFTDPDKLRDTWACGEADGRTYLETLNHT